jgi:hypothetical protein
MPRTRSSAEKKVTKRKVKASGKDRTEAHADYVCAHCGLPAWDWDGEDEYVCPNGCASDTMPATTILRLWDDKLDAGKKHLQR